MTVDGAASDLAAPGVHVKRDDSPTVKSVVGGALRQREKWGDMLPWNNWKGFLSGSFRAFFIALAINVALQMLGGAIFEALERDHELVTRAPSSIISNCT
jgi:hypothetical protein